MDGKIVTQIALIIGLLCPIDLSGYVEENLSMIYARERGISYYCTFGSKDNIESQHHDGIQEYCFGKFQHMVYYSPDGTKMYPFLFDGTPGGFVLNCTTNIKNGKLNGQCTGLIHTSCDVQCDPGYTPDVDSVTCNLAKPYNNVSAVWSNPEPCRQLRCPAKIDNGKLKETCNTVIGASCSVTCDKGYSPVEDIVTCNPAKASYIDNATAEWSHRYPCKLQGPGKTILFELLVLSLVAGFVLLIILFLVCQCYRKGRCGKSKSFSSCSSSEESLSDNNRAVDGTQPQGTLQPNQVPNQGAPQQNQVPNEGAPQLNQVPNQGAPQLNQVPNQGAPQLNQVPNQGAPQLNQVPNEGAPQLNQVPNQGAPQLNQVPNQGAPQLNQVPNQGAPQLNQVPNQGAPQLNQVPNQGAPQLNQVPNQGAPQLNQVPNQGAPQLNQVPNQGAPQLNQVPNQGAPQLNQVPNQNPQPVPVSAVPHVCGLSQRIDPSGHLPNQSEAQADHPVSQGADQPSEDAGEADSLLDGLDRASLGSLDARSLKSNPSEIAPNSPIKSEVGLSEIYINDFPSGGPGQFAKSMQDWHYSPAVNSGRLHEALPLVNMGEPTQLLEDANCTAAESKPCDMSPMPPKNRRASRPLSSKGEPSYLLKGSDYAGAAKSLERCKANAKCLLKCQSSCVDRLLGMLEPSYERPQGTTLEGYVIQTPEQIERLGYHSLYHFNLLKSKYNQPHQYFALDILCKMGEHGDTVPDILDYFEGRNQPLVQLILGLHVCEQCRARYNFKGNPS